MQEMYLKVIAGNMRAFVKPATAMQANQAEPGPKLQGNQTIWYHRVTNVPDDVTMTDVVTLVRNCAIEADVFTVDYAILKPGALIRKKRWEDKNQRKEWLITQRETLGLNVTDMAAALNTPLRTYQAWERGERTIPGIVAVAIKALPLRSSA